MDGIRTFRPPGVPGPSLRTLLRWTPALLLAALLMAAGAGGVQRRLHRVRGERPSPGRPTEEPEDGKSGESSGAGRPTEEPEDGKSGESGRVERPTRESEDGTAAFASVSAGSEHHLRGEARRLGGLLGFQCGLEWRCSRPVVAAGRGVRLGQRRRQSHLRGEEGRVHRLLGL